MNYINKYGEPVGEPCEKCLKAIWYGENDYVQGEKGIIHNKCKEEQEKN
jgi:hypothetical protein